MHNIEYIRNHPQEFDNALIKRGLKATSEIILKIDSEKRKSQTMLQKLQEERNILSKKIGESKKNNVDSSDELSRIEELKKEMSAIKELENIKNDELKAILSNIPNLVDDDVPIGDNEKSNLEIRK